MQLSGQDSVEGPSGHRVFPAQLFQPQTNVGPHSAPDPLLPGVGSSQCSLVSTGGNVS